MKHQALNFKIYNLANNNINNKKKYSTLLNICHWLGVK